MKKEFKITPSIYCADILNLWSEINHLRSVGINHIHFDVMDGQFVNNYGLSPKLLNEIKSYFPKITIDVHYMGKNFFNNLDLFKNADYITFHIGAIPQYYWTAYIDKIKSMGIKVGIALDLTDGISEIEHILPKIDLVTIMSIKSGFTGQEFNETTWDKINQIKKYKEKYPHLKFQVDGGVRWNNIKQLIDSDIDFIVVGSMLFDEVFYKDVMERIEKLCQD